MTVSEKFDLSKVIIEKAVLADEAQICSFFELMLIDTFKQNDIWEMQALLHEEIKEKCRFIHESLTEHHTQRYFLVAKFDDKIIGTIASGPANNDILEGSGGQCEGWQEIGTVFVHPNYQGIGVGHLMIQAIEQWLKNQGICHYSLDSGYKLAQKTWTKRYGEPTYLLKDHWAEGADHMIWCVWL